MLKRHKPWQALRALMMMGLAGLSVTACSTDMPKAVAEARYRSNTSAFISLSDGVRLHVRDEGPRDGPVLILAHGSNASLHTWERWVEVLKANWRLISFDFPGHGLTGPSKSRRYDGASYVQVVDELAQYFGVSRFVLAGHSMGGGVAWRYALAHPEKLSGLILVDAAGYPRETKAIPLVFRIARAPILGEALSVCTTKGMIAANLKQVMVDDALVTPHMVQRYYDLLMREGNRQATLDRMRAKPNLPDAYQSIPTIKVPTLILWGEEDPWIPLSDARRFAREIKGAKFVSYPGIGHLPQEEMPKETALVVGNFLQHIEAVTSP
ncbi:alpha/beta hydrolase [Candidatus Phycosocius spiralis]|uniref:Alpha/beta hydrolase n=1 Tax=Candidatus Phycosocius spiralis TaxID=2815099 RepID=A0ABQ4PW17_9PROT|nr:alpha/beta hydrolase [Candidatus Phycosocius spiralis]GIU67130.1 alpha/beta hydrolase [Candidatus Phycosocius spiralis]